MTARRLLLLLGATFLAGVSVAILGFGLWTDPSPIALVFDSKQNKCRDASRFDLNLAREEARAFLARPENKWLTRSVSISREELIRHASYAWLAIALYFEHRNEEVPAPSEFIPVWFGLPKGVYLPWANQAKVTGEVLQDMLTWDEHNCSKILLDAETNSSLVWELVKSSWDTEFIPAPGWRTGLSNILDYIIKPVRDRQQQIESQVGGYGDNWARYKTARQTKKDQTWLDYLSTTEYWPKK